MSYWHSASFTLRQKYLYSKNISLHCQSEVFSMRFRFMSIQWVQLAVKGTFLWLKRVYHE